jgi:hypothetical protein
MDRRTKTKESLKLTQRTKLDMDEKRAKETRKGQKEVCTGRNGLRNILIKSRNIS